MAPLKGRTWGGMPAVEYLYARLEAEDGEPAWNLGVAAKEVSKKLRMKVLESTISKWLKNQKRERREAENFEALVESTVAQLAKHAESGLVLEDVVDAQILILIARVHAEDGIEEATKFVNSLTGLKRAITSDRDSKQGIREYEESTAKLRATIERLTLDLKARGADPAALDDFNKQVVTAVDSMILAQRKR